MSSSRFNALTFFLILALAGGITPALAQEDVVLNGHKQAVTGVAFSPDGKTLASASLEKTVKLWDIAKGEEKATLQNTGGCVVCSQDGKYLVTGGADDAVRLWDMTSREVVRKFTVEGVLYQNPVAISPDGKTLAAGGIDKLVTVWDVATAKQLARLTGQRFQVLCVAFSPDGKLLAWGGSGLVRLWDVATEKEQASYQADEVLTWRLAFTSDGGILASGGSDKVVRLWDVVNRKEIGALKGHADQITSLSCAPDGKTLASGSIDKTVRLWDIAARKELASLVTDKVSAVGFSPDGKRLAVGCENGTVRLWTVDRLLPEVVERAKANATGNPPVQEPQPIEALAYRTWTSTDGRKVEAAFLRVADGVVAIRRKSDGKAFSIPLAQLSDEDQRWVQGGAAHKPDSEPAAVVSTPQGWPKYTDSLVGTNEVRVRNPNSFQVRVGLRSSGKGRDFVVSANDSGSVNVPDGKYEIYFVYSSEPEGVYQGDSFTLSNNGVEIQIVKVVDGNYGIRKVK